METYSRMLRDLKTPKAMERFSTLYGHGNCEFAKQLTRYSQLVKVHEDVFHACNSLTMVSSPGRIEIVGNHTDHQKGCVLAAAVNLDTLAAVSRREDNQIRVYSEGFPMVEISLDDLSVHAEEKGTSKAMVRGVAARLKDLGYKIGGFDAAVCSDILPGSGLSSSASYEVLICTIFDALFNGQVLSSLQRAEIAQYAENIFFDKPCGLMDQTAVSTGGMMAIDFKDTPHISPVSFSFSDAGYKIVVVNTGSDHKDLTEDYASIRREMEAVANIFDETCLRKVRPEQLAQSLPLVRKKLGDRAALRALHFFYENARVKKQWTNIKNNDLGSFFSSIFESGISSWTLLQNIYSDASSQPLAIALAYATEMLYNKGACRVHGGGFAGTTLNFVPENMVENFVNQMNALFGESACVILDVRPEGACVVLSNEEN